ncbi:MAG TPA: type I DNA topoisomerase [bacterium]|nr:type I DNA topoisomerase [bacterium]
MKLVIVESPTKAKTLSQVLPAKEYIIKASMGHIRDLPKSGLGVDIDNDFLPEYSVPSKAKKTLNELKTSMKEAEEIILATDPDREGEAISWHLKELLSSKKGKVLFKRVVFHELTKDAIEEAFRNPGDLDMNLVDAQQARRVLDRLVGYKLSPLLWKKVMYGLSAGRVQSVAVRLIVERERERQEFKPEEYWSLDAEFTDKRDKRPLKASLVEKDGDKIDISKEKDIKKIEKELNGASFLVSSVKKTERKKSPYPPYKTSTLQQAGANVLGFNASRTMKAAQGLFEKGYITYHRTDSLNLSPQFINSARKFIEKEYGKDHIPQKGIYYKTKTANAQEAHEAVRITDVYRRPGKSSGITGDELKIYTLIWKRSLECQMEDAVYDQTSISIKSDNSYTFRSSGSIVKFDGWLRIGNVLKIDESEEEVSRNLPDYSEGEQVKLKDLFPEQHFTQPPARYSDASLIKKLEDLGVGRPSTYAPTISTIQQRGYIQREGRYFIPKDVAYVVNDLLVGHFPEVIDYGFTAQMEDELDEIAEGKKEWAPVIRDFYTPFSRDLEKKDKELNKHDVTNLGESDEKCPKCGKNLVFKLGKYGKFLSCSDYPECEYAKPLNNSGESLSDEEFGECPNCEDGKFILKQGRFGKFLACSNYPKCKTTKPYLEKIGIKCPKCGEGDVVVKKAKYKNFYGCSRYPDCDWKSWKNPKFEEGKEEINTIS